jgi:hypothetical protein
LNQTYTKFHPCSQAVEGVRSNACAFYALWAGVRTRSVRILYAKHTSKSEVFPC